METTFLPLTRILFGECANLLTTFKVRIEEIDKRPAEEWLGTTDVNAMQIERNADSSAF